MADDTKRGNRLRGYYAGRTHATYTSGLGYHARPYEGSPTFKDMVKRAEQAMSDYSFKD